MAEWSKAPDSSSGPLTRAWVQIPLLTILTLKFFSFSTISNKTAPLYVVLQTNVVLLLTKTLKNEQKKNTNKHTSTTTQFSNRVLLSRLVPPWTILLPTPYVARVRFGIRVRVRDSAIFEKGRYKCGGTRRLKNY